MGAMALLGLGHSTNAYAAGAPQEIQQAAKKITGTVVDASGPVIGASVVVKGTSNGVATDFDGNFTLNANPGQTLVISYIGYLNKEVKISANQTNYKITIEEDKQMLDEVVVVGYGTMKKRSCNRCYCRADIRCSWFIIIYPCTWSGYYQCRC